MFENVDTMQLCVLFSCMHLIVHCFSNTRFCVKEKSVNMTQNASLFILFCFKKHCNVLMAFLFCCNCVHPSTFGLLSHTINWGKDICHFLILEIAKELFVYPLFFSCLIHCCLSELICFWAIPVTSFFPRKGTLY